MRCWSGDQHRRKATNIGGAPFRGFGGNATNLFHVEQVEHTAAARLRLATLDLLLLKTFSFVFIVEKTAKPHCA